MSGKNSRTSVAALYTSFSGVFSAHKCKSSLESGDEMSDIIKSSIEMSPRRLVSLEKRIIKVSRRKAIGILLLASSLTRSIIEATYTYAGIKNTEALISNSIQLLGSNLNTNSRRNIRVRRLVRAQQRIETLPIKKSSNRYPHQELITGVARSP